MSAEEPDRPGLDALQTAIEDAISKHQQEWDVTIIEAVGVLHILAARYAHKAIDHEEDDQ